MRTGFHSVPSQCLEKFEGSSGSLSSASGSLASSRCKGRKYYINAEGPISLTCGNFNVTLADDGSCGDTFTVMWGGRMGKPGGGSKEAATIYVETRKKTWRRRLEEKTKENLLWTWRPTWPWASWRQSRRHGQDKEKTQAFKAQHVQTREEKEVYFRVRLLLVP